MKRLKRILALIVVNVTILALGFVMIEIAFGGWLNPGKLNRLNLLRDCVFQYDSSSLYKDPNPIIRYSRDKYGLRGSHRTPDRIDILTVGGSTTDQRYIRDGETWQDVLQDCFRRSGKAVVVANAGVDGQSTYGHIKDFEWWFPYIPDLKPKYILYYVGLNDFYKEAGSGWDSILEDSHATGIKRQLQENSALWHMVRTLHGAYAAMVVLKISNRSVNFAKVQWTREPLQRDYSFMAARLAEYANRLRKLADLTRDFGAQPVFVTQPSRQYRITAEGIEGRSGVASYDHHEYNGVDYYYMMRRLDSVTHSIADEKRAFFVDLAGYNGWRNADFYDFAHMTPAGAKTVGTLLFESLKNFVPSAGAGRGE